MSGKQAAEIHRKSLVIDAHCDTLIPVLRGTRRLGERSTKGHVDLPRLREGGVTAQTFAIFHHWRELRHRSTVEALRSVDAFYQELDANRSRLIHARCAADIERAKRNDQIAAILSIEGAEPLAGDPRVLRIFHRLGVRMIALTWNYRNQVADGVGVTRQRHGLTDVGVALVREMNELGIVVDVAHLAPPGVEDVLRIARQPIIASHVGAAAVQAHRRNLTDAQLEGIARTGGVACATLVPNFLGPHGKSATLREYLDHVEHMIRVAGIDHVGLGSDFDGYGGVTLGMEDASCWPSVTAGLLDRGYSPSEIRKVLGENLLRVFREVIG